MDLEGELYSPFTINNESSKDIFKKNLNDPIGIFLLILIFGGFFGLTGYIFYDCVVFFSNLSPFEHLKKDLVNFFLIAVVAPVFGSLLTAFLLFVLMRYNTRLFIYLSMALSILLTILLAVYISFFIFDAHKLAAIGMIFPILIITLINVLIYRKLEINSILIKLAVKFLVSQWSLLFYFIFNVLIILIFLIWTLVAVLLTAVKTFYQNQADGFKNAKVLTFIILPVYLFFIIQIIISEIQQCVASRMVMIWISRKTNQRLKGALIFSFSSILMYNLGSITFVSLFIILVKLFLQMIKSSMHHIKRFLCSFLTYFLDLLEYILTVYGNLTTIEIGQSGKTCFKSAKTVSKKIRIGNESFNTILYTKWIMFVATLVFVIPISVLSHYFLDNYLKIIVLVLSFSNALLFNLGSIHGVVLSFILLYAKKPTLVRNVFPELNFEKSGVKIRKEEIYM